MWIGVVLETPHGLNDGSKNGIAYFECQPMHGLFVQSKKVHVLDEPTEEEIAAAEAAAAAAVSDSEESQNIQQPEREESVDRGHDNSLNISSPQSTRVHDVDDTLSPSPSPIRHPRLPTPHVNDDAAAAWQRAKHADAMQKLRQRQFEHEGAVRRHHHPQHAAPHQASASLCLYPMRMCPFHGSHNSCWTCCCTRPRTPPWAPPLGVRNRIPLAGRGEGVIHPPTAHLLRSKSFEMPSRIVAARGMGSRWRGLSFARRMSELIRTLPEQEGNRVLSFWTRHSVYSKISSTSNFAIKQRRFSDSLLHRRTFNSSYSCGIHPLESRRMTCEQP